jgi:hypothetical protein
LHLKLDAFRAEYFLWPLEILAQLGFPAILMGIQLLGSGFAGLGLGKRFEGMYFDALIV